jgi:hypothetical protein
MKNSKAILFYLCLMIAGISVSAQTEKELNQKQDQDKPVLFANLPEKISVSKDNLQNLFGSPLGKSITLKAVDNNNFEFNGEIISAENKYGNAIQSIVIKCSNYDGANFTLSKITNEDGAISYVGRIVSLHHADVYELKQEASKFVLIKRKTNDLINE